MCPLLYGIGVAITYTRYLYICFYTEGKYIQHRLYRESCLSVEGNFLKDLNVLGRDLARTILVDNSPHAFGYQVDNGIPIESWFDCPHDKELLKLERFLLQQQLASRDNNSSVVTDVRPLLRDKFQCQRLVDTAPPLPPMLLPGSSSTHEEEEEEDDNDETMHAEEPEY